MATINMYICMYIGHLSWWYGFMVAGQDLQHNDSIGCLQLFLYHPGVLADLSSIDLPTHCRNNKITDVLTTKKPKTKTPLLSKSPQQRKITCHSKHCKLKSLLAEMNTLSIMIFSLSFGASPPTVCLLSQDETHSKISSGFPPKTTQLI